MRRTMGGGQRARADVFAGDVVWSLQVSVSTLKCRPGVGAGVAMEEGGRHPAASSSARAVSVIATNRRDTADLLVAEPFGDLLTDRLEERGPPPSTSTKPGTTSSGRLP